MGEMKIELFLDEKPFKKRPFKLSYKYKDIVKREIDNTLTIGISYPVDYSKWVIPMILQPKKHGLKKLRVYVHF